MLQTDVGRPITDIENKLYYKQLGDDLREMLEKLIPKEIQVRTTEGNWFMLRMKCGKIEILIAEFLRRRDDTPGVSPR